MFQVRHECINTLYIKDGQPLGSLERNPFPTLEDGRPTHVSANSSTLFRPSRLTHLITRTATDIPSPENISQDSALTFLEEEREHEKIRFFTETYISSAFFFSFILP